jgi:hypothetical protein
MAQLRLRYVNEYADRTGKVRRYFRKHGRQLGPLPGEVGSEEFMTAYAAYLAEKPAARDHQRVVSETSALQALRINEAS